MNSMKWNASAQFETEMKAIRQSEDVMTRAGLKENASRLRREEFPDGVLRALPPIAINQTASGSDTVKTRAGASQSHACRDAVLVVLSTAVVAIVSIQLELSEAVAAWTHPREYWQLDELPGTLLALAIGLAWFAWRRYREARGTQAELVQALAANRAIAGLNARVWESERKCLARELHDELGQYLNAIKIDAVSIRNRASGMAPQTDRAASAIIESTDHVQRVVSGMIGRLRPVALDDLGLSAALDHCVNGWRERLHPARFNLSVADGVDDLGETLNLTIYRLAQEGLTNIAKHAQAREVRVELSRDADAANGSNDVVFRLTDDGVGTALDTHRSGLGLIGMRERVEALGGTFSITTAPGRGFSFEARLPFVASTERTL